MANCLTSTVVGRAFHAQAFADVVLGPTQINAPCKTINTVKTQKYWDFKTLVNKLLTSLPNVHYVSLNEFVRSIGPKHQWNKKRQIIEN